MRKDLPPAEGESSCHTGVQLKYRAYADNRDSLCNDLARWRAGAGARTSSW